MRSVAIRYPVDQYLVESSKKFEMVNIIDDELWNTEPALKPEDEIILRKLHEMLQSTADDLKLLSGELSKFHQPGVQIKTAPTPLDEEFNEKVHIEEIVNAKFHGYKIIDKSSSHIPECKSNINTTDDIKSTVSSQKPKITNVTVPVNTLPVKKKPVINRNLGITRTKVIQINGSNENSAKTEKLNNGKIIHAPAVAYNEYSYKYIEPKHKTYHKNLQVQEMPSINIRSELKEQKVLLLDITPEVNESAKADTVSKNVAVVAIQHEIPKQNMHVPTKVLSTEFIEVKQRKTTTKPNTIRKVSKLSTCDSSGSNNVSSDTQIKLKTQERIRTNIRTSPKSSAGIDRKKAIIKKGFEKRTHSNVDEWRKKLNSVYGPSVVKKSKSPKLKSKAKIPTKKSNISQDTTKSNNLNNVEYIPYSKLTVGGVRASDIEREISDISNKNDLPLSPILDKILSSRENSFINGNHPKHKQKDSLNVFTTSDENLLQEVIDIERTVSETLSKNIKIACDSKEKKLLSDSEDNNENDSYADDFEDENSDCSEQSGNQKKSSTHSNENKKSSNEEVYTSDSENEFVEEPVLNASNTNIHNLTYTKISNLSFKNTVDIFEFVHSVERQDSATQSNIRNKISPKETQTSPTDDKKIQPIHNDLWPSIDPKGEVEKMFQIEKEFIKKLIVEEYGDLLEKNIDKPSTSKEVEIRRNVAASQKNTQTSPAHVKNVMTSPTRTKTRTTSPFPKLTVDHHTSPLIFVTNEEDVRLEIENEDDAGISINLSSPRFSLRLPRTSREVLSNLGDSVPKSEKKSDRSNVKIEKKEDMITTSSSSLEADSSEISSLGEIKLRKKFGKTRIASDSESVTSSSSKYSSDCQTGILPLRSEGEMSLGQIKKSNKYSKSEGEASFGML